MEPFLGSGAVLLAKPGGAAPREVVCDTNGHIANFFRALTADPDEVPRWADWPTVHQDLTAPAPGATQVGAEHAERLSEDPFWVRPQAAGFWVWGISSWIGHGWCDGTGWEQIPGKPAHGGHKGVQMQRKRCRWATRCQTAEALQGQGQGVQQQRVNVPGGPSDKRPDCGGTTGQGQACRCSARRCRWRQARSAAYASNKGRRPGRAAAAGRRAVGKMPVVQIKNGERGVIASPSDHDGDCGADRRAPAAVVPRAAQRLARVIVLNRSWDSAVTDSVLQQTPSSPKPTVAVVF